MDGRCDPGGELLREDLRLIEMSLDELDPVDRDGKNGIVPAIRGDGLREPEGPSLTGLKQVILPGIFDAVEQFSYGGDVFIDGPDMVQMREALIDESILHWPDGGVEVPGAGMAKDPFLQVECDVTDFTRRRVKKTDEGFFVGMGHECHYIIKIMK